MAHLDHIAQIAADVQFIKQAVARDSPARTPAVIYLFWAVASLVGFALVDVRDEWVPAYWTVVGPVGFVVSAYLGRRQARRDGRGAPGEGKRHLLHWGATLVAIALTMVAAGAGTLPGHDAGRVILLVLAVSYFLAGVHLDRSFMWVGVLLAAGAVVVSLGTAYAWTLVGVAAATALIVAGLRSTPREVTQ